MGLAACLLDLELEPLKATGGMGEAVLGRTPIGPRYPELVQGAAAQRGAGPELS